MFFFFCFFHFTNSVDQSKYRKCSQSPFCIRNRSPGTQKWSIIPSTAKIQKNVFEVTIDDTSNSNKLKLIISFLECGAAHVRIQPEKKENFVRFDCSKEPTIVDQNELSKNQKITMKKEDKKIVIYSNENAIEIEFNPFLISLSNKLGKRIVLNADSEAIFETNRDKKKNPKLFEEHNFGGHTDSFKNGPTSVAMSIDFTDNDVRIGGLPSHTLPMSLKQTVGASDPIRMFNTDINRFEVDSVMSMYGSIPFILTHSLNGCDGVFWCNPSETWADVTTKNIKRVRLISEGGYIDLFMFSGKQKEVVDIYTRITGRPQLIPMFALGFHQCRWGYMTSKEVLQVDSKLDEALVPHDVLWLDLDHTDNRKYFTFNPSTFKNPHYLLDQLDKNDRHLVVLVDPHLKVEKSYNIYAEAQKQNLLILKSNGKGEFVGNCWPGKSVWPDFLNPKTRSWWETNYRFDKFKESKHNLHIWNDMNEIAVFDSCDLTAPRDLIHYGNIEEREVHNIYGHLMVSSSFGGLVNRDENKNARPFILTRSFFAGSQKYAAVWTGDNTGDWKHLANSIQMVLTYSFSSQVYCGADVGGFFDSPDENLLSRWYQVGAWLYPFFRTHCHHLSNRREVFNIKGDYKNVAREAIVDRYKLLYYWYLLSRNANLTGEPIIRPLWWEFNEKRFLDTDDKAMVGKSLLVVPFLEEKAKTKTIELPNARWYNYRDLTEIKEKSIKVKNNNGRTPVFLRGGSIIPIKTRIRKSSQLMFYDPFTLLIGIDENGKAEGQIYVDDEHSFDFMNSQYIMKEFIFNGDSLKSKSINDKISNNKFAKDYDVVIEKIIITGMKTIPSKIIDCNTKEELSFELYNNNKEAIIITRLNLFVSNDINVKFIY